jgi:hypothetical protein
MSGHLYRKTSHYPYLPAYDVGTDSVPKRRHIKIQTPGNYPEESIQHSEQGESSKSRTVRRITDFFLVALGPSAGYGPLLLPDDAN